MKPREYFSEQFERSLPDDSVDRLKRIGLEWDDFSASVDSVVIECECYAVQRCLRLLEAVKKEYGLSGKIPELPYMEPKPEKFVPLNEDIGNDMGRVRDCNLELIEEAKAKEEEQERAIEARIMRSANAYKELLGGNLKD